jgi:hypothetical protein
VRASLSRGRLAVLGVAAIVLATPSAAQVGAIHTRLAAAGLLPEKAVFAELAIKQYDALYKTVTYEGDVHFDVVATNESTQTETYTWSATVGPVGKATRVDGGHLTLAGGGSKEIPLHFRIPDCLVRNKISVRLAVKDGRSPEVHFWVLTTGSAAWKISGGPNCGA